MSKECDPWWYGNRTPLCICSAQRMSVDVEVDEYAKLAHSLVDTAINRALEQLSELDDCPELIDNYVSNRPQRKPRVTALQTGDTVDNYPNITWLTTDEFTEERGKEKINEFIQVVC